MVKYYRLDKEIVQDCLTEIPQSQWEKKQVLPYEENIVELPEGKSTTIVEGLKFYKSKVVNTRIKRYYVPTLEEYKTTIYNNIKSLGSNKILMNYSLEQQMSAHAGFYSAEENEEILRFAKAIFDLIRSKKALVFGCTTKEECDEVHNAFEVELNGTS